MIIASNILRSNTLLKRDKIRTRKTRLKNKVSMMKTHSSLSGAGALWKMPKDHQRSPKRMMASETSMINQAQKQQKWKRKICIKRRLWKIRNKKALKSSRKQNQLKKLSSGEPHGGSKRDLIMDSMSLRRRRLRRKMMTKIGTPSKDKKMTLRNLKKRKKHQRSKMMKVSMIFKMKSFQNRWFITM